MKKVLIAIMFLTSMQSFAVSEEKKVDNSIKGVTVYLNGAQVTRTGSFYITPGVSKLMFEGISAYTDQNSIQAKGAGDFTIMDVKFETHYPQPDNIQADNNEMPPEVRRKMNVLRDSITNWNYKLEEVRSMKEVLTLERNMLMNNGTVKGVGKVNDSIPLLKDAMEYFHEKMTEINMGLFRYKKQEDVLVKDLSGMRERLQLLENWRQHNQMNEDPKKGPIHRVVVTVSAERNVRGTVDVAYIVSQAGWKPSYDIRAKDIDSGIELNYKAEVYQNTGIDWEKIPLTLSTANPYANHQKPNLSPWYISYYQQQAVQYEDNRSALAKRDREEVMTEDMEMSVATGSGGIAPMQEKLNYNASSSVNYTTTTQNMISAEYEINLPYTIESNGEMNMVAVAQKELKADYHLALVPKMDRHAYLVANVTEWNDLNLVPAKARVYYDGMFVGSSYIDPMASEDTLRLAMGKDNGVYATRTKLKDKSREKVIGDNKVRETHYEIIVKNSHSSNVEIVIEDQVPVSNQQDIKVSIIEQDKAELNEYTGILTWRFKLKGGASEKIHFAYEVKYDKNRPLSQAY